MERECEHIDTPAGESAGYSASHSSVGYGERYKRTYQQGHYHYQWQFIERNLVYQLLSQARDQGKRSYLDFACGTGRILTVACEVFDAPHGVDVSETMLQVASEDVPNAKLILCDVTTEPIASSYDVITAFRFFTNAENALRISVLRAIHRMLDDRGVFIANIHVNSSSPNGWFYRLRNAVTSQQTSCVSYSQFEKLLRDCGFEITETHWYGFLPRFGWYFSWLPKYFMKPIERICRVIFMPKSLAACFVVVCRKSSGDSGAAGECRKVSGG